MKWFDEGFLSCQQLFYNNQQTLLAHGSFWKTYLKGIGYFTYEHSIFYQFGDNFHFQMSYALSCLQPQNIWKWVFPKKESIRPACTAIALYIYGAFAIFLQQIYVNVNSNFLFTLFFSSDTSTMKLKNTDKKKTQGKVMSKLAVSFRMSLSFLLPLT